MSKGLTKDDVTKLMTNSTGDVRAEMATKIARQFDDQALTVEEMAIAEDIFRVMARDIEVQVREALSGHLKACPELPRDVAIALANDVDSVALPVLKCSDVLQDEDLIEIVRGHSSSKQLAIAQRETVSSVVADALIDTGRDHVVARLVANEGAELSEAALGRVTKDFMDSTSVADSMSRRQNLPPSISEKLLSSLSERLQSYLSRRSDLSSDLASDLIMQVRERATVELLNRTLPGIELDRMVEQLHRHKRLTPSLLLRAICVGDQAFFETAIAKLAEVPLANARILIHDEGNLGLQSIYERANLPPRLFPAFRGAIAVVREVDYDGGKNDRERYLTRTLERILTYCENEHDLAGEDLDYLMDKLHQIAA